MSAGSFHKKHILVTGASGFLGRQVVTQLLQIGANVLGIDKRPNPHKISPSEAPFNQYKHLQSDFESALHQVRDFLSNVPLTQRGIFHCAGLAEAGRCQQQPDQAFNLNVALTLRILELCRQIGGATFVFPSTGLVYGDQLKRPASEADPIYPTSVYAATKLSAEALIQSYAANFSCASIIARISNVYGPDVGENTVVGKIISQIACGDKLQVFDERPVRDFIFAQDVAEALIRLYPCTQKNSAILVNVSRGKGIAIGDVLEQASQLFSLGKLPQIRKGASGDRPSVLVLSNRKLKKMTGWLPPTSLVEGLRESLPAAYKE